jgi:hypothetical protein
MKKLLLKKRKMAVEKMVTAQGVAPARPQAGTGLFAL